MDTMPRTDRLRGQASDIHQLVDALVHHYAAEGWHIDGPPHGGALEFTMRRGREACLVDCAYADQDAVSRIPVEELLDEIVLRGATGGVLVTRGVFTNAALDAAAQRPHVRLVDGVVLASMMGARVDGRRYLARLQRGLARLRSPRAADRPAPSLAIVTAGVFLLSLTVGLLVLVAYLLTAPDDARAATPGPVPATPAPLPAPQAPPQGYVAYVAGREGMSPASTRQPRIQPTTHVAPADLPVMSVPSEPVLLSRPVEGPWDTDRAPPSPTAADEAIAVIAGDTPEVVTPE